MTYFGNQQSQCHLALLMGRHSIALTITQSTISRPSCPSIDVIKLRLCIQDFRWFLTSIYFCDFP